MDPKGKVALVTGGARIGQVVAHSLAERGCELALIYRGSRGAAEASAKAAINAGVRAITIRADATDEDQIAAAVKETHRALGRIDILLLDLSEHAGPQGGGLVETSMPTPAASFFSRPLQRRFEAKHGARSRLTSRTGWSERPPRYRRISPRPLDFVALAESLPRWNLAARNSGQCDRARADS